MNSIWQTISDSYKGYGNYLWNEMIHPSWHNYFYWLIGVSLFFFTLEIFRPWNKTQPRFRKGFWMDVFYMFFNFFIFSLIIYEAGSNVVVNAFNEFLTLFGIRNLVAFEVMSWPPWTHLLLGFVLRDFIQWNVHRLLHRVPFLWEFHKVHHSVEQMGFAAHLRYHWMETVVYRTIEYLPLAMIGIGLRDFFVIHIFALFIGHFNHSNIRVNLGVLKYVFNNPQMHKWHHAYTMPGEHRYGINFGISLSIWDYLFGTNYQPYEGENLRLGFPGIESFPQTFWQQITYGFRKKESVTRKNKKRD